VARGVIAGRYELDPNSRRRGGMGEVWFGYDKRLDRPVAIKFIRSDSLPEDHRTELIKRFVRESRITARLEHPGVPAVYDCGTDGDDLYLVMQRVKGSPLTHLVEEIEQVPVGWAAAIAAQVCSVLSVAHASSLVHRDLKPSNLMLCPDGTVKVLDFGIAATLSPAATRLTATGAIIGTAEYMAPEQAMSNTASPQSDLYSLGVVLYELLAGRNPFAAETPLASMRRHADVLPPPLREVRDDLPAELERLVFRLLAKDPCERPPSAIVVYERLLPFCQDLPPLPGFVDGNPADPVRMYAAVVGSIAKTGDAAPLERKRPPVEAKRPSPRVMDADDIARARKEAEALKAASRYAQAADLLARAVEDAARSRGPAHADVLELRSELADMRFLGGDYRRAAAEFQRLAAELAQHRGEGDERVLRFRLMEANCHAALGETTLALTKLTKLLEDARRLGGDEDLILELRRNIGLLELGSGDRIGAVRTLRDLLPDMELRYGAGHPNVAKVREILDAITGT